MCRGIIWVTLAALLFTFGGGASCGKDEETQPASLDCSEGSPPDDFDCDGVPNLSDNCLDAFNPSQIDEDLDGVGDLCEIVPCGDGVCDPEGGECDVFDYCTKDCTQSLCFGLAEGETCGDGICQPLAGECSDFDPCLLDCPDPGFFCFPPTCGDGVCQPWEDNVDEQATFCFFDCICEVEKAVADECHTNADCAAEPGTVCGPTSLPIFEEGAEGPTFDFSLVACECTTCGNSVLDEGEGCDPSAGFEGVEECLFSSPNATCNGETCKCEVFSESEAECADGEDDDFDGLTDCADVDDCCLDAACASDPACSGATENCDNACVDDDGDSLADCNDPDCGSEMFCAPSATERCRGCVDDDGDLLVDCEDTEDCCGQPSCEGHPACGP